MIYSPSLVDKAYIAISPALHGCSFRFSHRFSLLFLLSAQPIFSSVRLYLFTSGLSFFSLRLLSFPISVELPRTFLCISPLFILMISPIPLSASIYLSRLSPSVSFLASLDLARFPFHPPPLYLCFSLVHCFSVSYSYFYPLLSSVPDSPPRLSLTINRKRSI